MTRRGRLVVGLVVLALVGAAIPAASAATGASPDGSGPVRSAEVAGGELRAAETPTNATTHHENPDDAGQDGSLADAKSWLLGRISDRLGESTLRISQGQYDAARDLLGGETRDFLGRFVDVAGETESEEDDRTGETLNETVETQEEFTETTRNYTTTYEKYLEARRNGNLTRARQLARKLLARADEVSQLGDRLAALYGTLGDLTGVNTTTSRRRINTTTRNVTTTTGEIRELLFEATTLSLRRVQRNVSFVDPLVVRGRVVAENGTGAAIGRVVLRAGGRRVMARPNATGHFRLRYRPVLLPVTTDRLRVEYVPPSSSEFLGSDATVNVSVRQVEPTIELEGTPATAGFGDRVRVTARVVVAGRPVEGVPLSMSLGEVRLDAGRSGQDGVVLDGRVPASVDDGDRVLRVAFGARGRAIAPATASRQVEVVPTATRLQVDATTTPEGIRVTGRLTTAAGEPLGNRTIDVTIGDAITGQADTNATGRFATVLSRPGGEGERQVDVVVAFEAPTTNLEPARTRTQVLLAGGNGTATTWPTVPTWAWGGLLALVGVFAAGYGLYARRESRGSTDESAPEPASEPGSESTASASGEATAGSPFVEFAREALERGAPDDAVQAGYEAVRTRLASAIDADANTHWEFYRACVEAGLPEERIEALRRLTEYYERAAYARGTLSAETAREAIELVDELARSGETPPSDD